MKEIGDRILNTEVSNNNAEKRQTSGAGALSGMILGAIIGFLIAGLIGAIIGGMLGGAIGDESERRRRSKNWNEVNY